VAFHNGVLPQTHRKVAIARLEPRNATKSNEKLLFVGLEGEDRDEGGYLQVNNIYSGAIVHEQI